MRYKKAIVTMGIMAAATLVGCSKGRDENAPNNAITVEQGQLIADAINNLQTQIDTIEENLNDFIDRYDAEKTGNLVEGGTNQTKTNNQTEPSTTKQVTLPNDFSEYLTQANTLKKEVTDNKDTKMSRYHELRSKINELEQTLDLYDNKLEEELRNGTIVLSVYSAKNKEIDAIEDVLDQAEDLLEIQFGLND